MSESSPLDAIDKTLSKLSKEGDAVSPEQLKTLLTQCKEYIGQEEKRLSEMLTSTTLKSIEAALAKAASANGTTSENVKHWLDLRKQCLEQDAQRSRTVFRRVVAVACLALVFIPLIIWFISFMRGVRP